MSRSTRLEHDNVRDIFGRFKVLSYYISPWGDRRRACLNFNCLELELLIMSLNPSPLNPSHKRQPGSLDDEHTSKRPALDQSPSLELTTVDQMLLIQVTSRVQKIAELDNNVQTFASIVDVFTQFVRHPDLWQAAVEAERTGSEGQVRGLLKSYFPASQPVSHRLSSDPIVKMSKQATVKSWQRRFVGTAHEALWNHITLPRQGQSYAPYCAIVQSSGMGKSRCIDEFSKEHFVIPMNLRNPKAGGYPASDEALYKFFTAEKIAASNDQAVRMCAFLISLFQVLNDKIEKEYMADHVVEDLAPWFRKVMTEGQTFDSQNEQRVKFYNDVVKGAESLIKAGHKDKLGSSKIEFPGNATVPSAVEKLEATCKDAMKKSLKPAFVLAFDEAHTLMRPGSEIEAHEITSTSSPFSHLQSVLRSFRSDIFSVFLSTTGKITQFTPPRHVHPSGRLQTGVFNLIPPFTALGWDHLAQPVSSIDTGVDLQDIGFEYQVHLGRPLFGSRYDAIKEPKESKEDNASGIGPKLVQFAVEKLLCGSYSMHSLPRLSEDQAIACLSQRLPIEFMSTVHTVQERRQVENHMRVCIHIHGAFISMTTMNPSEPLLAEAAIQVMGDFRTQLNIPQILVDLLTGFSIHAGDRGELVGMLLMTLARDEVIRDRLDLSKHRGFFSVIEFLKKLFTIPVHVLAEAPTSTTEAPTSSPRRSGCLAANHASPSSSLHDTNIHNILEAKPSVYCDELVKNTSLEDAFVDVYMHFNHIIKRSEQHGLTLEHLLGFFVRNAAFMFANSKAGVDFGAVLCRGVRILRTSAAVFLVQVKNHDKYTATIVDELFDDMDPVRLDIIKSDEVLETPMIRVVLALAGSTPALKYVKTQKKGNFTAYDIWASGLSAEVFPIVKMHSKDWQDLLQASHGWQRIYAGEQEAKVLKQNMTPMAGDDDPFWSWMRDSEAKDEKGQEVCED